MSLLPPLWSTAVSAASDSHTASASSLAPINGITDRASPAFDVDGEDDTGEDDELLSSLDSVSPPASPPLESVVSAAYSSELGGLSPARATYLQTLLKRFPCPNRSNVSELQSLVLESAVHHSSQSIVNALLLPSSPWLPSLYSLCAQLERDEELSGLQTLFTLLVSVVNLHDSELLSLLFDSQHGLHSLTVLEYDPAIVAHVTQSAQLTLPLRRHHHALRHSHCLSLHFSSAQQPAHSGSDGSIEDSSSGGDSFDSVGECLHQLHRLEYAKDVVLLSHLDDATAATLSQLCSQQRLRVIHHVQRDTTVHRLCRAVHVAADAILNAQRRYAANGTTEAADVHGSGQYNTQQRSPCGGRRLLTSFLLSYHCSDVCAALVSHSFSVSCRCAPTRLLLLDDEEEDCVQLWPSVTLTVPPQLRSFHRSAAVLRPRLGVLNSLLQLARNLTPSVRGSFVESVIEHDCIDSLTRILHSLSRMAHLNATRSVQRVCDWLLPAALSMLAALLFSCPDSFRSYVVESHALHSPTHSSGSPTGTSPTLSLLDSLLTALCNPTCAGSSGGGAIVSFLRQLCDGDEDDSSGEHVQQLQRLCIEGPGMAVVGELLARFSLHPRPSAVRRSAVCALDWLTFVAGKFKAVAVSRYASTQDLPETCKSILTRRRAQLPSNEPPVTQLLAAQNDVVCGALRLLSCLIRCHRPPLIDAIIQANVLHAVLQSVLSSNYLILHSTSLLTSAALDLFNQLTPVTHLTAVRQHLLQLQPHMQHIAHTHVISQMMQRCNAYHKQHAQQQFQPARQADSSCNHTTISGSSSGGSGNNQRTDRERRKRRVKSTEDESGDNKRSRRPQQDEVHHRPDAQNTGEDRQQRSVRERAMEQTSALSGAATERRAVAASGAASPFHSSALLVSLDYYDDDDEKEAAEGEEEESSESDSRPQPHRIRHQRQCISLPLSSSTPRSAGGNCLPQSGTIEPLPPSDPLFESATLRLRMDRRQQREAEEQRADLLAIINKRAAGHTSTAHTQQQHVAPRTALSLSFKRPTISFSLNAVSSPPAPPAHSSADAMQPAAVHGSQLSDAVKSVPAASQQHS